MPEAATTSATADENFTIRSYLGQTVLPAVSEALMDLEKLEERCVASRARPQFAARDRAHHRSLTAHRPERPIEWLANRLLEIRDRR